MNIFCFKTVENRWKKWKIKWNNWLWARPLVIRKSKAVFFTVKYNLIKKFKPSLIGAGSFLIACMGGSFCGDGIVGDFLGEGKESTVSIASDA